MKTIYDIKGYCNYTGEYTFTEDDSWEGKIILNEDGWFEGIVKDNNQENNSNSLIFGIYFPNKGIKLFKISPKRVNEPLAISAMKEEIGYEGPITVIRMSEKVPLGASKLITRKNKKEDPKKLEQDIETFLETEDYRDLYQIYKLMRSQVSESLLKEYSKTSRQYKKKKEVNG